MQSFPRRNGIEHMRASLVGRGVLLFDKKIAAVATDTWGMEVRPNELPQSLQPLHIVTIVYMGLTIGEIFDLEEISTACARHGRYEFLFAGPPLPFTGAVGSPLNPVAVL